VRSHEIAPIGCKDEAICPHPFAGIQHRFQCGRATLTQRLGRESPHDDL
jgi:hypothetical protein